MQRVDLKRVIRSIMHLFDQSYQAGLYSGFAARSGLGVLNLNRQSIVERGFVTGLIQRASFQIHFFYIIDLQTY